LFTGEKVKRGRRQGEGKKKRSGANEVTSFISLSKRSERPENPVLEKKTNTNPRTKGKGLGKLKKYLGK